jgi:hypothetical protein
MRKNNKKAEIAVKALKALLRKTKYILFI